MKNKIIGLAAISLLTACSLDNNSKSSNNSNNKSNPETSTQQPEFKFKQVSIAVNDPDNSSLVLEFNKQGKLVSALNNGRDASKDTYTYDNQGRLSTITEDYQNDGSNDSQSTYTYNNKGQLDKREIDNDINGGIDSILKHTYNDKGLVAEVKLDSGGDQVYDRIETFTYTDSGKIKTESSDNDGDGNIDRSFTFNYDASDRLDEKLNDQFNDVFDFTFNDKNQLTLESVDFNNDGSINRSYGYKYDAQGRVTENQQTENGTINRTETIGYDQHNNPTSVKVVRPGEDDINISYTYTALDFENNEIDLTISIADHLENEIFIDTPTFDGFFLYRARMSVFAR